MLRFLHRFRMLYSYHTHLPKIDLLGFAPRCFAPKAKRLDCYLTGLYRFFQEKNHQISGLLNDVTHLSKIEFPQSFSWKSTHPSFVNASYSESLHCIIQKRAMRLLGVEPNQIRWRRIMQTETSQTQKPESGVEPELFGYRPNLLNR